MGLSRQELARLLSGRIRPEIIFQEMFWNSHRRDR
jgi:hypothetical protein